MSARGELLAKPSQCGPASQGSAKLREILELTERAGMTLRLARVKPAVRELLRRDHALDRIGADRIHGDVDQAATAQMITADTPQLEPGKKLNPP